jgi:hypothetical protein
MDLFCIEHSRGDVVLIEKFQIFLIFKFGCSLSCIQIRTFRFAHQEAVFTNVQFR